MNEKEYQLAIVDHMVKNENKLSELYAKYAHAFPTRKEFWNDIAREEVSHGAWINTIKKRIEEGVVTFSSDRFNADSLNDFYECVQQEELKLNENMPLKKVFLVFSVVMFQNLRYFYWHLNIAPKITEKSYRKL